MPATNLSRESQEAAKPPEAVRAAGDPISRPLMVALVSFFVIAGYAQSVRFGLWFDDHPHFLHLKERGWSHKDAVETAYLAVPGEVMDYWGRSEPLIRYYRPVAFTLMKIEYIIAGWRPEIMHLFSMAWHFLCAMLVGRLAMKFLGSRTWATVAACMMAIHPAHVGTVTWIACQTELITTALQLTAILAYSRHARWGERLVYPSDTFAGRNRAWFTGRPQTPAVSLPATASATESPVTAAILLSLLCFALSLGCRENAVLLPIVFWIGDRLCGAGRRKWLRWEHIAMLVMIAVYLCIRHWTLQGFYSLTWQKMAGLSQFEMVRFMFDKPIVYLLGIFSYVPIMPGLTVGQTGGPPVVLYGIAATLLAAFVVIWRLFGRSPALLWPLVTMLLTMAPTIPIYPSAHHLYLPSFGGILLMTSFIALVGGIRLPSGQRLGRLRKSVLGFVIVTHVIGLTALTLWRGYGMMTSGLPEDLVVDDVIKRSPKPIRPGDHLFFINIPNMAALYCSCAVRAEIGLPELYAHALTYSPDVLCMEGPATLEVIGSHRLRVRAPADDAFLKGMPGQIVLSMLNLPKPKTGDTFTADLDRYKVKRNSPTGVTTGDKYTVIITDADDMGIRELEFVFNKRLDSPEYHFYFGSPRFMAYPVDVSKPTVAASRPAAAATGPEQTRTAR